MTDAAVLQRRTNILAILRVAAEPMSTRQVWEALPPEELVSEWGCPMPGDHDTAIECVHARQVHYFRVGEQTVYQDLRGMADAKLIEKCYVDRKVYWLVVNLEAEVEAAIASIRAAASSPI